MQSLRFKTALTLCTLTLVIVGSACADMTKRNDMSARKTGWQTSFSQAEAEAKATGKPLLIHFYADWCGPCQQMERNVLNQPRVLRVLASDVVGVKVNADHHPGLKSRFGVSGFPSDVLVSPEGKVSKRYVGATSESSFIARLKREAEKYPGTQLADKAEPKATRKKTGSADEAGKAKPLGLEGYSPVQLVTGQIWKKGKAEHSALYRGIEYHFTNESELELFLESPAKYAPRLLGCDPVILSESGRAVQGQIAHGALYQERVFLMASEKNRKAFLDNPAFYAEKHFAVEADEIEQLVSR